MCHRCADIDYPIGDVIWLPCGGSSSRYMPRSKRNGYSDEDGDGWAKVIELVASLNRAQAEIAHLQQQIMPPASQNGFEGVE